ncbi:MAG: aspartate/glutamate racemase family protein [Gammaproteobacteria bacterium]|nr:aspartate/glutamate racemase family protein [Gammaproteobacteria bacterium]
MKVSRRVFLAGAAGVAAVGCSREPSGVLISDGDPGVPLLGLIFPPSDRGIPEEGVAMYGERLRFVVTGLGLDRMTPDGYDSVVDLIPRAAEKLAAAGAEAIELTGTSLTFYKGEEFNQRLRKAVVDASGLPATTMSDGVIEALKAVGAGRVAVATAYNDEVNARLGAFLREHNLEPVVITGLGIEAIEDVASVTQQDLLEFSVRVRESAPDADSVLVSCGGFRTLELIAPIEERTGVPVISSMPHGLWAGARLVGLDGSAPGYGSLLSESATA